MSYSTYLEKVQNIVQVIETTGGDIGNEPGLVRFELSKLRSPVLYINASTAEKANGIPWIRINT